MFESSICSKTPENVDLAAKKWLRAGLKRCPLLKSGGLGTVGRISDHWGQTRVTGLIFLVVSIGTATLGGPKKGMNLLRVCYIREIPVRKLLLSGWWDYTFRASRVAWG